ncbi:hypothetical protein BT63DRAFT_440800 [Microthyrium microscopicum]|uniref:Uncharacterized protein n=1 Tax=Microthyrium microscopicum TaxID=703497 RepID=A0A6A6U936_9PEZI|nr:hypothetical protein BT63DRAFT_440800 [Microthyrium microscopicum]
MKVSKSKTLDQEVDLAVKLRLLSIIKANCLHKERPKKHVVEEARRDMLDSIAYLCDIRKGGATVTATALQRDNEDTILWLAANEGIRSEVKKFTEKLLEMAREVKMENVAEVETKLLSIALEIAVERVNFYQLRLASTLELWPATFNDTKKRTKLVRFCYELRSKKAVIEAMGEKGKELWHYIYRLGAHLHAVKKLTHVATNFRTMLKIKKVEAVRFSKSDHTKSITLSDELLDPYQIVKNICTEGYGTDSRRPMTDKIMVGFVRMDIEMNIKPKLQQDRTYKSRVHAELQLADLFSRKGYTFLGEDRYVGCSKGACYFCYEYLSLHQNKFERPATHGKVLASVHGLENSTKIATQKDMTMKLRMIRQVENDIIQTLLSKVPEDRKGLFMSSNGSSVPSVDGRLKA